MSHLLRRVLSANATLALAIYVVLLSLPAARAIAIDTVPIGYPGNANDSFTGNVYGGIA